MEFRGPNGEGAREVLDDLTFSEAGPTCVADSQPPSIQILIPAAGQTFNTHQVLLHFRAQDTGTGIARIRLSTLDSAQAELSSGFICGGDTFPRPCQGLSPSALDVEQQFWTYPPPGTFIIRLEAWDFAGNAGQSQVIIGLALPEPTFNLWVMGMEVTQGIQMEVPVSMTSRSIYAPQATLTFGSPIPLVAGKRTVARVYAGVEGTTIPVAGARVQLECRTQLGATLGAGERCPGPVGADLINPQVMVDPQNNNSIDTLRRNPALTWNFLLPSEWTAPGGLRWLIAYISAPSGVPECGNSTSGCDDGANLFILQIPGFYARASLVIQPRFACVRQSADVPAEQCTSLAATQDQADDIVQSFLLGADWDHDGMSDPFFLTLFPVADGVSGIDILPSSVPDYFDGDFSKGGVLTESRMQDYLRHTCDEFILDFWEIFTDPSELIAEAYYKDYRILGILPILIDKDNNTAPAGIAYTNRGYPCAIAMADLGPGRVGDGLHSNENDFCQNCPNDSRFVVQWDETTITHELIHTFGISHASCDHGEGDGGGCDPAPSEFPCPSGGICLSASERSEPWGFNTSNMAVLPPHMGLTSMDPCDNSQPWQAHDLMSYGCSPRWISPYTYGRLFDGVGVPQTLPKMVSVMNPSGQAGAASDRAFSSPQIALFVSGSIRQPGDQVTFGSIYQLPVQTTPGEGTGTFSLELQDAGGQSLVRRLFEPARVMDGAAESFDFAQAVPLVPGADRLVIKRGVQVIAERVRSSSSPMVNVVTPVAGDAWLDGRHTIRWAAIDSDGDAVVFAVQYSRDAGRTWRTLALNRTESTLVVDTAQLPGSQSGQALIRVLASDGFNATIAESAPFTVGTRPPRVRIVAPINGAIYQQGQMVDLISAAIDAEDGSLGDAAYTWSSDRAGELGGGHELRVRNLAPGLHRVTVTARDSDGDADQASIVITIQERINSQPVADAGAQQTVPVGTTVNLDGRASVDPDGEPLTFSWRVVSAPSNLAGSTVIENARTSTPSMLVRSAGTYVVELVVFDGRHQSFPAAVTIEVVANVPIGPGTATPPTRFYGSVTTGGLPPQNGAIVAAFVNGVKCGEGRVLFVGTIGTYVVDVASAATQAGCGRDGDRVTFTIDGVPARESASFESGRFVELNLTTPPLTAPARR